MERILNPNFPSAMRKWKVDNLPPGIVGTMDWIVRNLTSLGLSHNDLIPRNLLRVVDMSAGMITSIVDWDTCTPIFTGGEYARAVSEHSKYPASAVPGQQNIFLVLLRHRTGDEILLGCSDRNPARRRKWPLVTSKSSQIFSPPVTDPRYQSFSVATEDSSYPLTYSGIRI